MGEKRVLLVDDSKFARLMVRAFIESAFPDWTVDEAENGEEAIEVCSGKSFDYCILDHNMPGMTGLELGERLRQHYPNSHFALLTANIQQEIQRKAADLSMDFLAKPPTKDKIVDYLKSKESSA